MTKNKLAENLKLSQCKNGGHTVKGRKNRKMSVTD